MNEINTITALINNMQAFVNEATNINANDNISFDLKIERLTALSEKYDLAH
jgi:hypothetical protein